MLRSPRRHPSSLAASCRRLVTVLTALAWLGGCAPRADAVVRTAGSPEPVDPGPSSVEGEIGGMDEYAMVETFNQLQNELARCVEQGSARIDRLGGQAKVALRVRRDGSTRWAYLQESTLGDRETERCVLDLVRRQRWPRPLSGEGLAETNFEVEPREEPPELDPRRLGRGVSHARSDSRRCRRGVRGAFRATVYLTRDGRVMSAGVAPPSEEGESVADCVVEAIENTRFGKVGHKIAKVSFEL